MPVTHQYATPKRFIDISGDSDKSFTVPVGELWTLGHITSTLTTSATVGTRVPVLTITNAAGVTLFSRGTPATTQLATQVSITTWCSGGGTWAGVALVPIDGQVDSLPSNMVLLPGDIIRVRDRGAAGTPIDLAGDTLTLVVCAFVSPIV